MAYAILRRNGDRITTNFYDFYGGQFTGEKIPGELSDWNFFSADPNKFVKDYYGLLTAYCTTLYHTSPMARAAVEKILSYLIGTGVVFRSHIPENILQVTKAKAREWSRTFSELLHLEKQATNYYQAQQELCRESKITGDALLYLITRSNGDMEFVPVSGSNIDWQKENMGIRLDRSNVPTGVYIRGKENSSRFLNLDGVPQLIHFKFSGRPKQLRGYSVFYSEISRVKKLDRFWDAILARVINESIILGQYTSEDPVSGFEAIKQNVGKSKPSGSPPRSEPSNQFEDKKLNIRPGSFLIGNAGDKIEFTKPETPSGNFDVFNSWNWKMFGAATGYPPEFLQGIYSTSYTAHKGAINDAYKRILQERHHFCDVVEKTVNYVLLLKFIREGLIEPLGDLNNRVIREAHLQGNYVGPTLGHINPKQEVDALQIAVEQGFLLRSDASQQYSGNNFLDSYDEWYKEEEMYSKRNKLEPVKKVQEEIDVEEPDEEEE